MERVEVTEKPTKFQHYLPATYLARFSRDKTEPKRERTLWLVEKRTPKLFPLSAERACAVNALYDVGIPEEPHLVDNMWASYEPGLSAALDALIARKLDAKTWATTLVQFASALLIRGLEFRDRFEQRLETTLPGLLEHLRPDNTNLARLVEWQRLKAPMLAAKWHVLETTGKHVQITNDLGYAPMMQQRSGKGGIAIPIGHRHILTITATQKRKIATPKGRTWWPTIEYFSLPDDQHIDLLKTIADSSQRFVIGPDEATMRAYLRKVAMAPAVPEPAELGFFQGAKARKFETTYQEVLTKLSRPPPSHASSIRVDFSRDAG